MIVLRVIPVNQMTTWVRVWHWKRFRTVWYRVGRSGEDWREMEVGKRYQKQKSMEQIANDLSKKYPSARVPSILDEAAADREVDKVLKKNGKVKKSKV